MSSNHNFLQRILKPALIVFASITCLFLLSPNSQAAPTLVGDWIDITAIGPGGVATENVEVLTAFTNLRCIFGISPPDPPKCHALQAYPGDLFDIRDSFILIELPTARSLPDNPEESQTIIFSDLDWVDMPELIITSVELITNITGFDLSRVAFDSHSVTIYLSGSEFSTLLTPENGFIQVNLIAARIATPNAFLLFTLGAFLALLFLNPAKNISGKNTKRYAGGQWLRVGCYPA